MRLSEAFQLIQENPAAMADWENATGIPEDKLMNMKELGAKQRGNPEMAMVQAQRVLGGGVLSFAIEHAGDLTNRLSPNHNFRFAVEETKNKAEKVLRLLESGYGFLREHNENMRNNSSDSDSIKQALKKYARAHMDLNYGWVSSLHERTINIPVNIAIGAGANKQEFIDKAIKDLKHLIRVLNDREQTIRFLSKTL